jgi:hypothetical protein
VSDFSLEDSSSNISAAVYDWLEAEVNSSGVERNSFLDDYESAIRGLRGGWEHPQNFTARKLESHMDRLPLWYEAFALDPKDEYQAARLIFAGLMQVSGSYRNQCYIEATDAEDYIGRRRKIVGVNIQNIVRGRLNELLPKSGDFNYADLSVEAMEPGINEIAAKTRSEVSAVSYRLNIGYDLGVEGSVAAHKMQEAQSMWLGFTTDCIAIAAKIRMGELEAVPFLEPVSITDQSGKSYYPLREPVDWVQVLSS